MNPDQVYSPVVNGNGDVVGFSLGGALNTVFNPLQHLRMLGQGAQAVAQGVGGALHLPGFTGGARGALPPPPALAPTMAQAGAAAGANTIHAYMGLGFTQWTGTDAAEKDFSAEPQSAFIGNRLVVAARYSSGASGSQVTISSPLTVSGMPQTPAPAQRAPIEMFSSDTTYSALDLQIATSATQITISFSIDAAVGTSDKVNLSAGLFGQWIR